MSHILPAEPRESTNKGASRKLRAAGKLPAVVYGGGNEARTISIDPTRLDEIFRKTRNANTIVTLEIGGDKVNTLVREAQRHPLSRDILHVDFYQVDDERPVTVMVPVASKGKAKGAVIGGRIRIVRRELPVRCTWNKIPDQIEIDVTALDIGDYLTTDKVDLPDGVELALDNPIVAVQCYGRRADKK